MEFVATTDVMCGVLHFEIPCDTTSGSFCDTLATVAHPYLGYSVATCFSGLDQFGGQYVLARMDTETINQLL